MDAVWVAVVVLEGDAPGGMGERAERAKVIISTHFNTKQRVFLDFVLSQ